MIGEVLEVGDEVKGVLPKDQRDQEGRLFSHGEVGRIVGFGRRYWGRIKNEGFKPGVYLNRNDPQVEFGSGENRRVIDAPTWRLAYADGRHFAGREKRWKALTAEGRFTMGERNWVGELPDVPFWEGDKVAFRYKYPDSLNQGVVTSINYAYFDQPEPVRRRFFDKPIEVRESLYQRSGPQRVAEHKDLELIEHGDVWRYYHGEEIPFSSLKTEADLFILMGKARECYSGDSNFPWQRVNEFIDMVKKGKVDVFSGSNGTFRDPTYFNGYFFDDRELGERVRAFTLASFGEYSTPLLSPQDK